MHKDNILFHIKQSQPCSVALTSDDTSITFEKLESDSGIIAHNIGHKIVKSSGVIFVHIDKSVDTIMVLLGILKAGYAFFLLDTDWPSAYIHSLIEEIQPDAIIFKSTRSFNTEHVQLIDLTDLTVKPANLTLPIQNENVNPIAYLTATSGTTGKPKIIWTSHEAAIKLVFACRERMALEPGHSYRIGAISCYSFDAAIFDILFSLMNGFNLCIPTKDRILLGKSLANFIDTTKIDLMLITPTVLSTIPANYTLPTVKKLIIGGEPTPKALVKKYLTYDLDLYIAYGVAEAAIISTMKHISSEEQHMIIGAPLAGIECTVVTPSGKQATVGCPGKLCIHGNLCDTERSSISPTCIINIKCGNTYKKFFMTEDIVLENENGEFVFISRESSLVKINGVLISPTQIIEAICSITSIEKAALFQAKSEHNSFHERILCVYSTKEEICVSPLDLKKYLTNLLPKEKIPSRFYQVDDWPINRSGKTDFKKLREILEASMGYKKLETIKS